MQQVVDLQMDAGFDSLGVALLAISPDPEAAWAAEAKASDIDVPLLSDPGNAVATAYGVMRWKMPSGEPGHTFVLIDEQGRIAWIRDYGAIENGGLMYVPVADLVASLRDELR